MSSRRERFRANASLAIFFSSMILVIWIIQLSPDARLACTSIASPIALFYIAVTISLFQEMKKGKITFCRVREDGTSPKGVQHETHA